MIKVLKLQKAVISFILGILSLVAYRIMSVREMEYSNYLLSLAGVFFIAGALMFLLPIVFAIQNKKGEVELDPEKRDVMIEEEEKVEIDKSPL